MCLVGYDGIGVRWCKRPGVSHSSHLSVIMPPAKREMVIPVHVACWPVKAIPNHML